MPGGKAPIVGATGWSRALILQEKVDDLQSLLKWRPLEHPEPTPDEREQWRRQICDALGRYFGFQSTPLLTVTQRRDRLHAARQGKISPQLLDVGSRAALYQGREPRGRRWPNPLLVFLVDDLVPIWTSATGLSPRTRDVHNGKFPFYDWIAALFQACGNEAPKEGTVRDVLARQRPKNPGLGARSRNRRMTSSFANEVHGNDRTVKSTQDC